MKEKYKRWLGFTFIFVFGLIIGYMFGFYSAVKFMINEAVYFLQSQGVDFSMTAEQIGELVLKYKELIAHSEGSAWLAG